MGKDLCCDGESLPFFNKTTDLAIVTNFTLSSFHCLNFYTYFTQVFHGQQGILLVFSTLPCGSNTEVDVEFREGLCRQRFHEQT